MDYHKTILLILSVVVFYLYLDLRKERKRTRILSHFISGIMLKISKQREGLYKELLEEVQGQIEEDYWVVPLKKFVKKERNLFWQENLSNGGFNQVYLDLHDRITKEWLEIEKEREKESSTYK